MASLLPTAECYSNFRATHLRFPLTFREPADFHEPIPVSERLIQAVWSDQLFDASFLKTRDGRKIEIRNSGRWNVEGGPDFKGAQIIFDGKIFRGDIEIHLHTTGWNDHRHHLDPAYNDVILDVSLWETGGKQPTQTLQGQSVPQLVLYPWLQCSLDELVESLDPDRYPFSSSRIARKPSPLLRLPRKEVFRYIQSAGAFRFEQKTTRIAQQIDRLGPDQTAYQFLAEALGYKHNKIAFRQIAEILPLSTLARTSLSQKIKGLLSVAERQGLRINQVRPANHPHRRLAALALLVHEHPKIADWFQRFIEAPEKLTNAPKLYDPFWSHHYSTTGKRLEKPLALLGKSRWMEIVINVILPFCHAEAQLQSDLSAGQKILEKYRSLPANQINLASHQITYDLGLSEPVKAVEQQGLIQIYQDFDLMFPDSCS